MHLNIKLQSIQTPHFPGHGQATGQMGTMLRMMMHMMQQMMQLTLGQNGGRCRMARPDFGGGGCLGHSGNHLGNFLGSRGGIQSSGPHHQAPSSGHWQQAGSGGQLGSRLPGPLQRHAGAFEHYGKKYGVDPKFLAAISTLETGSGTSKAFRHKNNAMGVSNRSGPIAFGSVDQSIERMARVLAKKNGPYAGKRTIGQIAGVYCPVGAGNDVNGTNHHWPSMVTKFYKQLGGNPSVAVKT